MRLKVNVVRAPDRRLQDFKPRVPIDVLKRYGFEKVKVYRTIKCRIITTITKAQQFKWT